ICLLLWRELPKLPHDGIPLGFIPGIPVRGFCHGADELHDICMSCLNYLAVHIEDIYDPSRFVRAAYQYFRIRHLRYFAQPWLPSLSGLHASGYKGTACKASFHWNDLDIGLFHSRITQKGQEEKMSSKAWLQGNSLPL